MEGGTWGALGKIRESLGSAHSWVPLMRGSLEDCLKSAGLEVLSLGLSGCLRLGVEGLLLIAGLIGAPSLGTIGAHVGLLGLEGSPEEAGPGDLHCLERSWHERVLFDRLVCLGFRGLRMLPA